MLLRAAEEYHQEDLKKFLGVIQPVVFINILQVFSLSATTITLWGKSKKLLLLLLFIKTPPRIFIQKVSYITVTGGEGGNGRRRRSQPHSRRA